MSTPARFAIPQDYEDRGYDPAPWGNTLQMRLDQASRMVVAFAPTVQERIHHNTLDVALVTDIVCAMVERTVPLTDLGIPTGVESAQVGVDVFQQSLRFGPQAGGGAGALYISKQEKTMLGINTQKAFTISLAPPKRHHHHGEQGHEHPTP